MQLSEPVRRFGFGPAGPALSVQPCTTLHGSKPVARDVLFAFARIRTLAQLPLTPIHDLRESDGKEGNTMKSRAFLAGTLICVFSAPLWAQSSQGKWYDVKDANELRDIYSNKTFRGNGWVGHYRADGKGILIVGKLQPEPRTWQVKGNDLVCVTPSNKPTSCSRFQRNGAKPDELMVTNQTSGMSFTFTLEDGVPEF